MSTIGLWLWSAIYTAWADLICCFKQDSDGQVSARREREPEGPAAQS